MKTDWIKLNDWKKVHFPEICPFSGLKATETKDYYVHNTSVLWIVMRLLRVLQYIVLYVPFSKEGKQEMRKQQRKAILKGLLIGSIFAVIGLVIGVYISVEAATKQGRDLGTILGGCTFVFSLILGPFLLHYRLQRKISPLEFQKKDKELWVKIRNEDYRKRFLILNDFMQISQLSEQDEQILDREF